METDFYTRNYQERRILFDKVKTADTCNFLMLFCAFAGTTLMVAAVLIMGMTLGSTFLLHLAAATAFTCSLLFVLAVWRLSKALDVMNEEIRDSIEDLKKRVSNGQT